MDDSSNIANTSCAEKRPLVTFALVAYNQEKYIRQAVEGAFSQTYQPLEIILSDDGSIDRTFEIMQEMAAAYKGPHLVRLNRNPTNFGVGKHISTLFELSSAELIVLAAGDDVSLPERVSKIEECSDNNPNAYAFFSTYRVMETGEVKNSSPQKSIEELFLRKKWVNGAASAYRKSVYSVFGEIDPGVRHEDEILYLRALILGEIQAIIGDPLIVYRSTVGISAINRMARDSRVFHREDSNNLQFRKEMLRQWRRDLNKFGLQSEFRAAWDLRVNIMFLRTLDSGRRVRPALAKMYIKIFGLKSLLYKYLGYRAPRLINQYLRIRHFAQAWRRSAS